MLSRLKNFVNENGLFLPDEKILLAVSGGPDSVAMLDMFSKSGYNFAISHVNFKLRNQDSEDDEQFVRDLSKKYNAKLFVATFDTKSYAEQNKISIEMAARDLRYNEFERISLENGYNHIAVAHHQDDAIETFMLNLTRGTGIRGLTGMRIKNEKVIRPMLCFSRKEIENYLNDNNLSYRIDKSNLETVYSRNKIRNNIIPLFESINPAFRQNIRDTLTYLAQTENIYLEEIERAKSNVLIKQENKIIVLLDKLKEYSQPQCLMFEILRDYGFKNAHNITIEKALECESGKIFLSEQYKLLKDRDCLIITEISDPITTNTSRYIEKINITKGSFTDDNHIFEFEILKNDENFKPVRDPFTAYFDYEKLTFPIELRYRQNGDKFQPFGKNETKKLSDYFIDNKLNVNDKDKIRIMCSNQNIIWICGMRADNRLRVSNKTERILKMTMKKDN